ncbi:hypothetical protein SCRES2_gp84 [Synechococcus phage S-CRES2]|nr:hypothetical protein SCRES2_gp84 [Synechococcus phage S-CRES2]
MFHFGDSGQSAQLYREYALSMSGPNPPDVHWEEMSEKDLRVAFTYCYAALARALRDGADEATIAELTEEYDRMFQGLAQASDEFCLAVLSNRHQFLPGYDDATIEKYKRFAAKA